MKYFKSVMVLLAILFLVNGVSGCKGKSPAEKAGEKMEETQPAEPAEKAGNMIDETVEKVIESGEKLNDGMEKAIEKIDETMEVTEEKVNEIVGN
jgi:cytochrome c